MATNAWVAGDPRVKAPRPTTSESGFRCARPGAASLRTRCLGPPDAKPRHAESPARCDYRDRETTPAPPRYALVSFRRQPHWAPCDTAPQEHRAPRTCYGSTARCWLAGYQRPVRPAQTALPILKKIMPDPRRRVQGGSPTPTTIAGCTGDHAPRARIESLPWELIRRLPGPESALRCNGMGSSAGARHTPPATAGRTQVLHRYGLCRNWQLQGVRMQQAAWRPWRRAAGACCPAVG